MFQTPPPYYDRFSSDPRGKGWLRLLANPGKTVQSAEIIEMQAVQEYQFEQGMRHLFAEGQFVEGGDISITPHTTPGYSTGTVAVAGTAVTGTGTLFEDAGVVSGQVIGFGSTDSDEITTWYTIASVDSETGLTLVESAGTISPGSEFVVGTGTGFDISIEEGQLYASGKFHFVPAGTITITGVGAEVVGVIMTREVITSVQDEDLLDPAVGSEDYRFTGMDRLILSYQYAINNAQAVPIATFIDGQLVINPAPSGYLGQIVDLMALRTYEQSGNFVTTPPILKLEDQNVDSPTHLVMTISKGTGYPRGYRVSNMNKSFINVERTTEGADDIAEPHTYATGTYKYTLNSPGVLSVSRVQATLQSPELNMTRGNQVNGQDAIPAQYANVRNVIDIYQPTIHPADYVLGTDYNVVGNYIQWLPGGTQPATGSSYKLVVAYDHVLTKGIRTQTLVSAAAHAVGGPTTSLAHSSIQSIVNVIDTAGPTTLVEGTDFTVNYKTGVITWIASPTNVTVTYYYWAATVQGDYLSRDSFRDSAGSPLPYLTPNYSPNVNPPGIDYSEHIVFDTASGITPMNATVFTVDYTYALSRVDVLAWARNGLFSIFKGKPGVDPQAVIVSDDYLPIAKLYLPPDCTADEVTIEYYNNRTMLVTDLRAMFNQLATVQYNLAQFQLASNTINIPTPTNKKGVFADPLTDPHLADISSPFFGGTFDFFAQTFSLPRVQSTQSTGAGTLTITPAGASLKQDVWLTNYTESVAIQQTFWSELTQINAFQFVNEQAIITCDPPASLDVAQANSITVTSANQSVTTLPSNQIASAALLSQVVPGNWTSDQSGTGSTQPNQLLGIVTPNSEWVNVAQTSSGQATGLVSNNKWSTIQATSTLIDSAVTVEDGPTITISGSNFIPNERAIAALLDDVPLPLTGINGTTQDPTYDGCVVADSSGNFTATFNIPIGTRDGDYLLQVVGRNSTNIKAITSVASTNFTVGSFIQETALNVNFTRRVGGATNSCIRSLYAFAEALGLGTNIFLINGITPVAYPFNAAFAKTGHSSTATTIAYGIMFANKKGITVTRELLIGALGAMFSYQVAYPIPPAEQVVAIADAVTLNSTNVTQMIGEIMALGYWYLGQPLRRTASVIDPIAQVFRLPQDNYVTSVDLWFGTVSDSVVKVALANVVNNQPTDDYLAFAYLESGDLSNVTANRFTFEKPIHLSSKKDYCFVVMTEDPLATIQTARLGTTDQNGDLITVNPYGGSVFKSANAKSWQLDPTSQIRFNVNVASFALTQSTLDFGTITLPQDSSILSFFIPFVNPSQDCSVIYQYSLDGTRWIDFQPTKEVDLGGSFSTVQIRVLLNGTSGLCPQVLNTAMLVSAIYTDSAGLTTSGPDWTYGGGDGAYVHRTIDIGSEECSEVDVYVEVDLPGNTAIQPAVTFNESDWDKMTEVEADQIAVDDVFTERHYVFSTAVNTIQTTIAGTAATGESFKLTATGTTVPGGEASAISAITTGESAIVRATNLVAAINENPQFIAARITADNVGGSSATITLTWPSAALIEFTTAVLGGSSDTITSPAGGATATPIYEQTIRVKIGMASTVDYVTPRIRNIRVIAR